MTRSATMTESTNARRIDGGRVVADVAVVIASWRLGAWWRDESAGCAMRFCRESEAPTR